MKIIKILLIAASLSYITSIYADSDTIPEGFVSTSTQLMNWDEMQQTLKTKTSLPILFSDIIPEDKDDQLYYAYGETIPSKQGQHYMISFSTTEDCKGAKYCTVGSLQAEEGGKPEQYNDRDNNKITQEVKLSQDLTGYYTPAHAMGDFWLGMIVWQCNKVLYTLSWTISAEKEKDALIDMANSSIEEGKNICHKPE